MGGAIALWCNHLYPDYFQKIICLSPATDPKVSRNLSLTPFKKLSKLLGPIVAKSLIKEFVKANLANKHIVNDEMVQNYLEPYLDDGKASQCFVQAFTHILRNKELPQAFEKVNGECLILWGEEDKLTKVKYAPELKKYISNMQLFVHPTAGHHIMEDEPKWVAEKIISFLS